MKNILYLLFLLIPLFSATIRGDKNACYTDKGIKTARIYAKREYGARASDARDKERFRELTFDRNGNVIRMWEPMGDDSIAFYYQYENGKLMRILRTRNSLLWEALDSVALPKEEWTKGMDTTVIMSHDENGLPAEQRGFDGVSIIWSREGCEKEVLRYFDKEGNLFQEKTSNNDKGLLELETTLVYTEPKWTSVTHYFDYKFNRRGHWIKRKYRHGAKGVIEERRELEYY